MRSARKPWRLRTRLVGLIAVPYIPLSFNASFLHKRMTFANFSIEGKQRCDVARFVQKNCNPYDDLLCCPYRSRAASPPCSSSISCFGRLPWCVGVLWLTGLDRLPKSLVTVYATHNLSRSFICKPGLATYRQTRQNKHPKCLLCT